MPSVGSRIQKDSLLTHVERRLQGSDNVLQVTSAVYHASPLVVQGRGAGADVTAAGVLADMVDIALQWDEA